MESENIPEINLKTLEEKPNPNSIGEVLNIGKDLPTSPDKVYRSVGTKEAIDDIESSGIVRNKQSAGIVEKSRWGERVFWSKGAEGKYHAISQNSYVIEAPLSIAQERIVQREDITAIYKKNEHSEVIDILKQKRETEEIQNQEMSEQRRIEDEQQMQEVRRKLGIGE